MTSNELDILIRFYQREGVTYGEAVQYALTDILDYINTDMSILQLCRQQWYNRKVAGSLTSEFDKTCKEIADYCKRSISTRKAMLQ